MRIHKIWLLAVAFLVASGSASLAYRKALSLERRPGAHDSSQQSSPVFTTAHRSALEAIRDYFGWYPAPAQPIAFTHKVHLAKNLRCTVCHVGVDKGPDAQLPSVAACMVCHSDIATEKPEIKKLAAYADRGEDISWQRVYAYSPAAHLKFNHAPHIRAGINCATCHGDMTKQTVAVRSVNLTMGYCIDCHRMKNASVDCVTCHY